MKKILIVQGGGRPNGNTAQLAQAFERGAREAGHNVEMVSLLKTEVKAAWDVMHAVMKNRVSRRMDSTN